MMEWISVEDRLPESNLCIDVWCYLIGGENYGDMLRIPDCFFDCEKEEDCFWFWGDNTCEKIYLTWAIVTHWMPLPEPPQT